MHSPDRTIERAVARFAALAQAEPALRSELERTRSQFVEDIGVGRELGARRHLEWFLFERPSEHLEGVPAEALQARWHDEADPLERELFEALLGSFASAFVVTRVEPGEGLVVRDLFGLSELAVLEPGASEELAEGDLLVGRVFPIPERGVLLSPAVSAIRDATLVAALERDVEHLRAARRGVLRIQQVELERMFFLPGSLAAAAPVDDPLPAAVAALRAAGADERLAEDTARRVAAGADGGVVTEVLNELAFHTSLALEPARQALVELWAAVAGGGPSPEARATGAVARPAAPPGVPPRAPDAAEVRGSEPDPAEVGATARGPLQWFRARAAGAREAAAGDDRAKEHSSVRAALASFDEGRAEGRDLEELFGQLERDLGLDDGAVEDDAGAPDFPGVVGAMVAEYRWETEQDGDVPAPPRGGWLHLDAFAEATRDIGVFEDLSSDELVRFAVRDALDQGRLTDATDARTLVDALDAFAAWCDADHGLDLRTDFAPVRDRLADCLPRLAEARRALGDAAAAGGAVYEVAFVGGSRLALRLVDGGGADLGEERELDVAEPIARHLASGDLVRVQGAAGAGRLVGVHPSDARAALSTR